MPTLLVINSSAMPASYSSSRKLVDELKGKWVAAHPGATVIERDVATNPVPFVTAEAIMAYYADPAQLTPEQKKAIAISDTLVNELIEADHVIIGVPMYNFGIPASLKAWIDAVVRVGKTFSIGADGYKGLLNPAKKIVLVFSRGGNYSHPGAKAFDLQTPYMNTILGFMGAKDIKTVIAENQARSGEAKDAGFKAAIEQAGQVAAAFTSGV